MLQFEEETRRTQVWLRAFCMGPMVFPGFLRPASPLLHSWVKRRGLRTVAGQTSCDLGVMGLELV